MKKISVAVYEDDAQFDVEVFNWSEVKNKKDVRNEELTDYAFQSLEDVEEYMVQLRNAYEIVELKMYNEENIDSMFDFEEVKPTYSTYLFESEDLEEYLSKVLHKYQGFEIPVSVSVFEESLSIDCPYEGNQPLFQRVRNLCLAKYPDTYHSNDHIPRFQDFVLETAFGSDGIEITVTYDYTIYIHVPIK